jgi:NAD(P)-dependent dehydrogenase (short-subunit alcohol dehydrogenase family)
MPDALLKTAIVTGAARRIGRAIALDLARRGWSVALHCRVEDRDSQDAAAAIRDAGGRVAIVPADLAVEAETRTVVERAASALGPITCLVNNASAFEPDGPSTATRASWDLHLEINLRAPFVLTQALVRQLPAAQSGQVVNLLDQRVWNLTPYFLTYTLSKSALWTLTRTLALSLAPRVRVNAVGPGPTLKSARQSAEDFARQSAATPLKRGTTPEEICAAIAFILDTPAMTGQMIALDGGQHLGWAHPGTAPLPRE